MEGIFQYNTEIFTVGGSAVLSGAAGDSRNDAEKPDCSQHEPRVRWIVCVDPRGVDYLHLTVSDGIRRRVGGGQLEEDVEHCARCLLPHRVEQLNESAKVVIKVDVVMQQALVDMSEARGPGFRRRSRR